MSEAVKIAFEQRIQVLPLSALLPLRAVSDDLKASVKYQRVMRSIAEVAASDAVWPVGPRPLHSVHAIA